MPEWVLWVMVGVLVLVGAGLGFVLRTQRILLQAVRQLQDALIQEGRLRRRKWSDEA